MDRQLPRVHGELGDARGEVRGGDGVWHRLRTRLDQLVDLCMHVRGGQGERDGGDGGGGREGRREGGRGRGWGGGREGLR